LSASAREVVIRVDASRPSLLVHTDSFYPGWEATLDGEVVPIHVANLIFRGIPVEAGTHEVVLRYRPPLILAGLWGMPLALLMLVGMAVWEQRGAGRGAAISG
jgi:uncharacterized membrane protein YfhO